MSPSHMIWNNECRKTRRLLALWVGNDLDERDAAGVERHLAVCPHCREVRQGLHQSQQALDASRPAVTRTGVAANRQLSTSVWPGAVRHISSIDERSGSRGWHDWLPTGALAAACVAMIAALVRIGANRRLSTDHPSLFVWWWDRIRAVSSRFRRLVRGSAFAQASPLWRPRPTPTATATSKGSFPMPLFEFRCSTCSHDFELLIRSRDRAACPHCGGGSIEKLLSETAPPTAATGRSLPVTSACSSRRRTPCSPTCCRL